MDAQSRLKNIIKLSHRVTVYCPSQDDKGQPIPNAAEILDSTLSLLSSLCGGCTATPAIGCWVTGNGQLIKENVVLAFAFCQTLTSDLVNAVIDHAEHIKELANQESVAVEIDGELYLL